MAADRRFIPDAAQTQTDILPVQAFCDGARNAGLADTRRADETDDLPLDVRSQFADGQYLKDPVFDLFQAVVVAVKDLLRLGNVQIILGEGVPRQIEAGIQIGADDRTLLIAALHLGETIRLLQQLLLALGCQMQGRDLAAVLLHLGGGVIVLPQLFADHVKLLMQVVVALVFVHRFVHFLGDLLVDLQHPAFPVHLLDQQFHPPHEGALVQNGLLILKAEQQVGRNVLRQESRVAAGGDAEDHILADVRVQSQQIVEALFHIPYQNIQFGAFLRLCRADGCGSDCGKQETALRVQFGQFGTVLALDQNAHQIIRHPHDLLDLGDHTVGVQIRGGRILDLHIFLRDQKDVGIVAHRPLDGGDALITPHLKMKQIVREDHQPAQGDGRKMDNVAFHLDGNFFRHT